MDNFINKMLTEEAKQNHLCIFREPSFDGVSSDTRVIRLSSGRPIMKTKELQANCW